MVIKLYNSLSGEKEDFIPLDNSNVKMYVCGPTVYSTPHIGNIRSAVVYDIIFRVLLHFFPKVTYVRNITDIDDKIIEVAKLENKTPEEVAVYYEAIFKEHLSLLECLEPTFQPKATENIGNIIRMIEKLIENGNAYISSGHVYFDISSFKSYGKLSGKKLEDLIHGARVEVQESKKNPGDFVLWKPDNEVFWESPWGRGRPGWHIECSAMSVANLGKNFDLHGGGADLKFPHHENEIAQSYSAYPGSKFAKYWIHNGFLTVNGEKMSKSLGNIVNVDTLIESGITPNIIRFVLIGTHYTKPLNWQEKSVEDAKNVLIKFKLFIRDYDRISINNELIDDLKECNEFFSSLLDDFNTPAAIAVLHSILDKAGSIKDDTKIQELAALLDYLLCFLGIDIRKSEARIGEDLIILKISQRAKFKASGQYDAADKIRDELKFHGVFVQDKKDGTTDWISL